MAKSFAGKVVLITGASSGIGEALARELGQRDAKLALLARRTDRLESLVTEIASRGGEAIAVPCDVTRDGDCEAAVARTREKFGRIDVAVANAGFGVTGKVADLALDDFRRQFETNVFGLLRTTYAVLGALKETKGSLVFIGSVSAYLSVPTTAAYAMSKFAVRALAEALDGELHGEGVNVLLVNPGFVESEIRSVNNRGERKENAKDPVPTWLQMPKEVAARKIADAILARRRERNLTVHGNAAIFLAQRLPWVVRAATRNVGTKGRSRKALP
jgi:short-subunit dehydrogenase